MQLPQGPLGVPGRPHFENYRVSSVDRPNPTHVVVYTARLLPYIWNHHLAVFTCGGGVCVRLCQWEIIDTPYLHQTHQQGLL